jgi:predicted MPP superfamily phosphohydrolase
LHGRLSVTEFEVKVPVRTQVPAQSRAPLEVQVQGLAPPAKPLLVAFASDFHAGTTTDPRLFARLTALLVERRPDVLLLGGDFVSWNAGDVRVLAERLSVVDPPLGKFAVLGNHDRLAGVGQLVPHLERAGVRVLVNSHAALPAPFDAVSICGIDDPWSGSPNAAAAFEGAGPVRIFLTHSPDGILLVGTHRFDVAFAGHTHGGQVAFKDGTPIVTAGGPLARSHSRGCFDVPGNGSLYVSRGVGCSNLPLRINADPELVLCTLRFAAPA